MGRHRHFSDEETVRALALVFVAHGYNGASLQMLTEACGVGRQSLYNSIGDKKMMYLKSVECAASRFHNIQAALDAAPNGREALVLFFERLAGDCASADPMRNTCMVSSGLLEQIEDPVIAETLQAKWAATRSVFRNTIKRGKKDGSIRSRQSTDGLAVLLITFMSGLHVTARVVADGRQMRLLVRSALAVLDQD